jgi:hypothetical protein
MLSINYGTGPKPAFVRDICIIIREPVVDRGVGDGGSCPGHQGRGTKDKNGNRSPMVRQSGAQSGNLAYRAPETIDPPLHGTN